MNELTIHLEQGGKKPLYEQIYDYIKENIQEGKIPKGEKLPSTRALSAYLGISRSTVTLAYEQLLSEGYIEAEACRGYFAAQIEALYRLNKTPIKERESTQESEYEYDFNPNGVDLKSFPYNIWKRLSKDTLLDGSTKLFCMGDAKGEYGCRRAICDYLYQARGVSCTPAQIIIGAGSDYLLMLLCILFGKDCKIGMENPAYKQAYHLFVSQSFQVEPISMDRFGMEIARLRAAEADIAYVTPSHQYPTGVVMPIKRRLELLNWAGEREERYIVEDDYDSEYRYKGKPIPALKGYDRYEKVVYLGTFSKAIAPSIRLSYMALPRLLMEMYEDKCGFLHSTVSRIDQIIVQKFIEGGYYERHLNKMRALYKSRRDCLIAGLKPLGGKGYISGEYAGLHLLLNFEKGRNESTLIEQARSRGVRVYGLSDYIISPSSQEEGAGILLGYAGMTEEKIEKACEILCGVWNG